MGGFVPVDHDPFAPNAPQMALPGQTGAASYEDIANTGYMSPADKKAMAYDVILNNGKGLAGIINQSPAHEGARAYQRKVGEESAALQERQRAGAQVLGQLTDLSNAANEMHGKSPDDFRGAIGPYNTMEWNHYTPFVGGMTAPQVSAAYGGSGASWDIQNRLQHMIHGLTTAFVASAGKGGVNMSDSRQKAFEETMGAMMKATTKEEFDKITHDAGEIIRKTFNLPPSQARAVAQDMGDKVRAAAAGHPAQGGLIGGLSGAAHPMQIPGEAIADLRLDTSKARRDQFDAIFGAGASDRVLRSR